LDAETVIGELEVGEALVSLLDEKGRPGVVERAWIIPPSTRIGPLTVAERDAIRASSVIGDHYANAIDRESAYERLKGRAEAAPASQSGKRGSRRREPEAAQVEEKSSTDWSDVLIEGVGSVLTSKSGRKDSVIESLAKSAARSIGSQVGREIVRGVLGSLLGGRLK
jgi:DNA helicase HerA-like ATPase